MFTRDSAIISHNIKTPLTSISRAVGNTMYPSVEYLVRLVKSLFSNGEQGFFYDPNDLSTMYQDAAGTVPVTGAGQAVGLMLDKSKGLVLGAEKVINGGFSTDTNWTKGNGWVISGGVATHTSGTPGTITQEATLVAGRGYLVEFDVSNATTGNVAACFVGGTTVVSQLSRVNGHRKAVLFAVTGNSLFGFTADSLFNGSVDNLTVKELAGNHAYQTASASRPILRKNAVTGANYLEFDGSDDFLQTNNIDFTSTDKVSLFAGVRKLSDTATGTVLELSPNKNTNTGVFSLFAPLDSGVAQIAWVSKGTTERATSALAAAPVSTVISAKGNISGGVSQLRIDGVTNANNAGSQGTGNYGNYPLYIGRRGGSSLPFNGHIYSLIGIGRLTTDSETVAIEKELAKRVGVTLNV